MTERSCVNNSSVSLIGRVKNQRRGASVMTGTKSSCCGHTFSSIFCQTWRHRIMIMMASRMTMMATKQPIRILVLLSSTLCVGSSPGRQRDKIGNKNNCIFNCFKLMAIISQCHTVILVKSSWTVTKAPKQKSIYSTCLHFQKRYSRGHHCIFKHSTLIERALFKHGGVWVAKPTTSSPAVMRDRTLQYILGQGYGHYLPGWMPVVWPRLRGTKEVL